MVRRPGLVALRRFVVPAWAEGARLRDLWTWSLSWHLDFGRRGVARALVTAVLEEARRRGLNRVTTRSSRAARPAFQRFGFVVDRENLDNTVRGVTVPNVDMHVDLAKASIEPPGQGTERALTRGASAR